MDIESYRNFCLSLPSVTEEFPFGPDTLVYKVRGKVFAIAGIEDFRSVSLKCDPELAIELREHYTGVTPGYHLNKKHWNSVRLDQSIPDKLVREWIQHSYDLVKAKAPLKKKNPAKKTKPIVKSGTTKSTAKKNKSPRKEKPVTKQSNPRKRPKKK